MMVSAQEKPIKGESLKRPDWQTLNSKSHIQEAWDARYWGFDAAMLQVLEYYASLHRYQMVRFNLGTHRMELLPTYDGPSEIVKLGVIPLNARLKMSGATADKGQFLCKLSELMEILSRVDWGAFGWAQVEAFSEEEGFYVALHFIATSRHETWLRLPTYTPPGE